MKQMKLYIGWAYNRQPIHNHHNKFYSNMCNNLDAMNELTTK